jgi:glucose-6-phosphate dehydrogenase assembly protein OpcA
MSSTVLDPEPKLMWRREDASMAEVLEALSRIRDDFARSEAGDGEHAHPRNCVMTLIAVSANQGEERRAQRCSRIIGAHHPAQSIVIREIAGMRGQKLDASIVTDVMRPAMSCAVECEIVTLHVPGSAADHIGSLVDPLVVSGVPTYLWWMGTPPFGHQELHDVLRIGDALVFDSARFEEPFQSFRGLSKLVTVAHHHLGWGDLHWSRLRPLREVIAQFFTPYDRRSFLSGITEVGIDYAGNGRGNRIAASYTVGWMASALGWKLQRATAGAGGIVAAHYRAGSRPIEVHFRSVPKERLASGELSAIRIAGAAQGTTFRLTVARDPERLRRPDTDVAYRSLLPTGGEDDAGIELTKRRAERHRGVLHDSLDSLHHTASGDPPGESRPKQPVVITHERRRTDTDQVLLTLIEIGDSPPLRHVQQIAPEDEAVLLLDLLATGTHDKVFNRSLLAAFELMRKM